MGREPHWKQLLLFLCQSSSSALLFLIFFFLLLLFFFLCFFFVVNPHSFVHTERLYSALTLPEAQKSTGPNFVCTATMQSQTFSVVGKMILNAFPGTSLDL